MLFIALFTCIAGAALVQLIRSLLLGAGCASNYWQLIHALLLCEGVLQMLDLGLAPDATDPDAVPVSFSAAIVVCSDCCCFRF